MAEVLGRRGFAGLVRAMGHDLRTPLNAILGYSEMLREDLEAEGFSDGAQDAGKIQEAAAALLSQIDGLVRLARMESEGVRPAADALDWAAPLRDAATRLGSGRANGVSVAVDAPAEAVVDSMEAEALYAAVDAFVLAAAELAGSGQVTVHLGVDPVRGNAVLSAEVPGDGWRDADLDALADPDRLGPPGRRGIAFKTIGAICRSAGGRAWLGRVASGSVELRVEMGGVAG